MKRVLFLSMIAIATFVLQACNPEGTNVSSGDKIDLKFRPNKGDQLKLKVSADQEIIQSGIGIEQTIDFYFTQEVVDVNENKESTIKVTYDRIKLMQKNPLFPISFDTDNMGDNKNPLTMAFGVLKGFTLEMVMDERGRVTKVKGVEELFDKMAGVFGEDLPNGDEMKDNFKKQYDEEAMKRNMQDMSVIYPDVLIGVGDTWGAETHSSGNFGVLAKTTYKVDHIDGDKVVISFESELEEDKDLTGDMVEGMNGMTGTESGTIEINRKNGFMQKSTKRQKLEGKVVSEMMGSIPMKIISDITIEPY